MKNLLAWLRDFFARLFRRAPPAPGYFVEGRKSAWHGRVGLAPFVWPGRDYLIYVPRGYSRWQRHALVVFIHGCKQTPEEFAAGTRIAAMADEQGWLVLLPRQTDTANKWNCWNWFDRRTAAGWGEVAIVLAQVREARKEYRVDPQRIFVAGFSSGGALAAAIGVRAPQLFAGVFTHSGIACGAASRPALVFDVIARGPDTDVARIGTQARAVAGAVRLPLLAIQGERDDVVPPLHAEQLERQYLALNGVASGSSPDVRVVRVPALAHAWGGGDGAYPYNDPRGPDATGMLRDFVKSGSG